ncbi:MAG: LuxR family transcriptional regulator [Pseudomonadota bacterium]
MNKWQEEQLHALLSAKSEQEFFSAITRAVAQLGFEQCSFGMRLPLPISNPKEIIHSNYNPEWEMRYMRNNYARIDPTVVHATQSIRPLIWSEELFSPCREFWEEARAYDLNVGWAQASHSRYGVALLSLARSHDALDKSELEAHSLQMTWLAQLAHEGFTKLLLPTLLPEASTLLTERETEVMRWTAEGKTSNEIGAIMNISHSTVNFHVNNAVAKLGVTNKTAAAIKAVALRLI